MTIEVTQPALILQVQTNGASVPVQLTPGRPVFVLGRNGTGKSALVHRFVSQLPKANYIPGSRPNYFDNESLSMTPATRRNFEQNTMGYDRNPQTRYRPITGTQRNEKAIHDLQASETQFKVDAANDIKALGLSSSAIRRLQSDSSPLDRVNELLIQSNILVSLVISNGELMAQKSGEPYSIAKMSDGERAALIIASEVISSVPGSIFIIDEPELHLHRSIVVPLLEALLRERSDCFYVVSTHELDLPNSHPNGIAILTRSCAWSGDHVSAWDVDVISLSDTIPEQTRVDILGSRRKVVFVEGTSSSLDAPLYAVLFPSTSVRSRETARDVIYTVNALRAVQGTHHAEAFGIVDGDNRSEDDTARLRSNHVFALPVTSVESIYYSPEMLAALAKQQAEALGEDANVILSAAYDGALASLDENHRMHLALRVAENNIRATLYGSMPTRADLRDGAERLTVDIVSPMPAEIQRITELHAAKHLHRIIERYPVRDSNVLQALARGLRYQDRTDFEKAALRKLIIDAPLRQTITGKFGELARLLA